MLAGLNPGSYSGGIETDLSKPLPAARPNEALEAIQKKLQPLRQKLEQQQESGQALDQKDIQEFFELNNEAEALQQDTARSGGGSLSRRLGEAGGDERQVSGVFTDYHYYGTGDIGGAPDEESVKRLEAIVTKGKASFRRRDFFQQDLSIRSGRGASGRWAGACDLCQCRADVSEHHGRGSGGIARYTGEMELTNHSAGSLTSQAYQKRWLRKEELLADAAEKASLAAEWLGARPYPLSALERRLDAGHGRALS